MMKKYAIALAILGLFGASLVGIPKLTTATEAPLPISNANSDINVASAQKGSALAKELQGKPVFVDIYASWCGSCQAIKPTLSTLKTQYAGKVHFVVFDVTNKTTTEASQAQAQRLGLSAFFAENKAKTSTVAIMNPATGQILKLYQANPNLDAYKVVLNSAIKQIH